MEKISQKLGTTAEEGKKSRSPTLMIHQEYSFIDHKFEC